MDTIITDTLVVTKGECIRADIQWFDEEKGIDLTNIEFFIYEAHPSQLMNAHINTAHPAEGTAEIFVSEEIAKFMKLGRSNWLRIGLRGNGECLDTSPKMWIEVV